ncbi:ClpP family protease [Planctomycetota bacterium]
MNTHLFSQWEAGRNAGYVGGQMYPGVIEKITQSHRAIEVDVRAKLIEQQIIFLGDAIYPQTANIVVSQMLYLQSIDKDSDIQLYINSPGGSVQAGLAIYDAIQYLSCDVSTICIGLAASMGAILLAAGTKGKRFCLPNARIMLHQPWTDGLGGTVSDVTIEAEELVKTKDKLNEILAHHCSKAKGEVEKDTDRNYWMSGSEAKEFGLVDDIVGLPDKDN